MNSYNRYLNELDELGFFKIDGLFSADEVKSINEKLDEYIGTGYDGIVMENNSNTVRGIHGPHLYDQFFHTLAKNKTIIDLCSSWLEDQVYIHQYKINMKQAMEGKHWPWHQDFIYWREFDHIQAPRLLNIAVVLDDISMLQGPLCFIPKSHKLGELTNLKKAGEKNWERAVSADLTYQLDKDVIAELLDQFGFEFMLAKAGDVIVFDPQLAHCSSNNLSANDRRLMIITVNAVSNAPVKQSNRPAFLAAKTYEPILPLVA